MSKFNALDLDGILDKDEIDLDDLDQFLNGRSEPAPMVEEIPEVLPPEPEPVEPVNIKEIHDMLPKEKPMGVDDPPFSREVDRGAAAIIDELPDFRDREVSDVEFQEKIKLMSQSLMLRNLMEQNRIKSSDITKYDINATLPEIRSELHLLEYRYLYNATGGVNVIEQGIVGGARWAEKYFNGKRPIPLTELKPNLAHLSDSVAILIRKRRYTTYKASNKVLESLGANHGSMASIACEIAMTTINQIGSNSMKGNKIDIDD